MSHQHFKGKEALEHVIEAQAQGVVSANEIHGSESSGSLNAGCHAASECALFLALIAYLFQFLKLPVANALPLLCIFSGSLMLWKCGKSAWLGWFRLERLHRVLDQERFEIEHHRGQERDELKVLYAAKGFEGKLLEDVLDVLMADNARLLKVMVEEELGLTLASQEHPLKQGFGALLGVLISSSLCLVSFILIPSFGIYATATAIIATSAFILASANLNGRIAAIVWNVGLYCLSFAYLYFLLQWLSS